MEPIRFPPFELTASPPCLRRGADVVRIRPKALAVLTYLARSRGRPVSREELLDAVWAGTAVDAAAVKVCVRELRRALGDEARRPTIIETLPDGRYRFAAATAPADMQDPASTVVGREAEIRTLDRALEGALAGRRRIAFVTGEAGIGKSALVEEFLRRAAVRVGNAGGAVAIGQCDEHHGAVEPFSPFLDALGRMCRAPGGRAIVARLREQAPSWLLQLPGVLRPDEREALRRDHLVATRERMLRELVSGLEAMSEAMPLVLVLEDLHWCDPASVDLLAALGRRRTPARLLVVATLRPADAQAQRSAVATIVASLCLGASCDELALQPLDAEAVSRLVGLRLADADLAHDAASILHRHTKGHPLFLVHAIARLAAASRARDAGPAGGGAVALDLEREVPESLREIVAQQLDALAAPDRELLEAAAAVGLEFAVPLVAAALECDLASVERRLVSLGCESTLVRALGVRSFARDREEAWFAFAHAFHRDLIYERLTPGWRARLHDRIGRFLEQRHGRDATVAAAELASHFDRAGDEARAIRYLEMAAENALACHADRSTEAFLVRALELLARRPDDAARAADELRLRARLGPALLNTRGFAAPEVEACYSRALELCRRTGESPALFPVLEGLQSYFAIRGPIPRAYELSRQMGRLARQTEEPLHLVEANHVLGCDLLKLGRFRAACDHLERAARAYDPARADEAFRLSGHDPKVCSLSQLGVSCWFLGLPDTALGRALEAVRFAEGLAQPMSLALARFSLGWVHLLRGESAPAREPLAATVALADEEGLPYWSGFSRILLGWAIAHGGALADGLEQMSAGYEICQLMGGGVGRVEYLLVSLRARGDDLEPGEALAMVDEAEARLRERGERYLDAEVLFLRGTTLATRARLAGSAEERDRASACFAQAVETAREVGALGHELRAATSLAELHRGLASEAGAREALASAYARFAEGLGTEPLRRAREVLVSLEPPARLRRDPQA